MLVEEGANFEPGFIQGSMVEDKTYTIYVAKGTRVSGANIFLDEGNVYVGEGNKIEPGVGIKGPTIIGQNNDIRQGAYFRGDVIIGDGGTFVYQLSRINKGFYGPSEILKNKPLEKNVIERAPFER